MPAAIALAVDVGGTKVEAALVDSRGALVPGSRFRRPTGHTLYSDNLAGNVREVVSAALAATPVGAAVVGVGVGSAGPIRQSEGLVSPLNLPAWRDFPLVALISESVSSVPVVLGIDGLCITIAEHWVGAARGFSNVMGMVVSTGIGGGLVLDGRAVPGPSGNAGHIGHVEVGGAGEQCACGGSGCLEAVASGPRTVAWAVSQGWDGRTGEELAASYSAGHPIAIAAVERSGRAIGRAIGSATSLLDLDIVTIGGGFSQVTPDLFDFIRRGLDDRETFDFVKRVQVVPTGLSSEGPLIGAAALIHRPEVFVGC